MKGVVRFDQKGKLALMYIGPYEILGQVGKVAYKLALPPSVAHIHNVFNVNVLKKCNSLDGHSVIPPPIELVSEDLTYSKGLIRFFDLQVKNLRTKWIPMVKAQW